MTKDDKECIKYILYQTKHGVSLEETLLNLGYVKINSKKKEEKEMEESLFNLILQTATYNGEVCYNSMEEMEGDYKVNNCVSLNPTEIKRLVFTAYEFGKNKVEVE